MGLRGEGQGKEGVESKKKKKKNRRRGQLKGFRHGFGQNTA